MYSLLGIKINWHLGYLKNRTVATEISKWINFHEKFNWIFFASSAMINNNWSETLQFQFLGLSTPRTYIHNFSLFFFYTFTNFDNVMSNVNSASAEKSSVTPSASIIAFVLYIYSYERSREEQIINFPLEILRRNFSTVFNLLSARIYLHNLRGLTTVFSLQASQFFDSNS